MVKSHWPKPIAIHSRS